MSKILKSPNKKQAQVAKTESVKNSESTLDELKRANEKLIQIETELRNRNKDLESQLAGKDKELKELQQKLNEVIKRNEKTSRRNSANIETKQSKN